MNVKLLSSGPYITQFFQSMITKTSASHRNCLYEVNVNQRRPLGKKLRHACEGGVMMDQGGEPMVLTSVQPNPPLDRLNWSVQDIDVVGSRTDMRSSIISTCVCVCVWAEL
jgi:hypothetical protein